MSKRKRTEEKSNPPLPGLDLEQVERLIAFMTQHGLEQFEFSRGDLHICLKKAATNSTGVPAPHLHVPPGWPVSSPVVAPQPAVPAAEPEAAGVGEDLHIIKSPIVGTFYAAPTPGADPYVKVGDRVETGQVVCIIEAMKLMNEIECDVGGEVARILAENGQPVEYGEPLFAIRPAPKK